MKLIFALASMLVLSLATAARADESPVPGGLLLEVEGQSRVLATVQGSSGGNTESVGLGGRAGIGWRVGELSFGVEGALTRDLGLSAATADFESLGAFAGWSIPLKTPNASLEIRLRGGEHRYFNVENGAPLFTASAGNPEIDHAALPFLGAEVRGYFSGVRSPRAAARFYLSVGLENDIGSAQLAVNEAAPMQIGGVNLACGLGLEMALH